MSYQQVTLVDIQTRLSERTESSLFWTATEKLNAINEVLRQWNMLTGMWHAPFTVTTVANQAWYPLPSTMVYETTLQFNGKPMDIDSISGLDNGEPGWEGESTTAGGIVPDRPTLWAPVGLNGFAIWPVDAVGANSILVDGIRQTPVLAVDADFIDIGQAELDALLGECIHILSFKKGGQEWIGTQSLHKSFLIAAAEQNARLNASTFFRNLMGLDTNRKARPMERATQTQ